MKVDELLVQADMEEDKGNWEMAIWMRLEAGRICGPSESPSTQLYSVVVCKMGIDVIIPNREDPYIWVWPSVYGREGEEWWTWQASSNWQKWCDSKHVDTPPLPTYVKEALQAASQDAVSRVLSSQKTVQGGVQ